MTPRLDKNPLHVLDLAPGATAIEIERAAKRVMAMMAVKYAGADTYASPLGPRPRDPDLVRWAAGELRDPTRRAEHARRALPVGIADPPPDPLAPWPDALAAFGWGPR